MIAGNVQAGAGPVGNRLVATGGDLAQEFVSDTALGGLPATKGVNEDGDYLWPLQEVTPRIGKTISYIRIRLFNYREPPERDGSLRIK